jgi:hypothetical protein
MNAVQLARMLGHGSLRMIEGTYSHLNAGDAARRAAVVVLPAALGPTSITAGWHARTASRRGSIRPVREAGISA